jgi:exopolysaccharide production protein ExoZ
MQSPSYVSRKENDPSRLDDLQALRAIAAAMVVFEHAIYTHHHKILGLDGDPTLYGLGDFGVRLFFCISGFIIFSSASKLLPGWPSVKNFAVRRLIRIVPLYWCVTAVYAVKLSLQGTPPTVTQLLSSLFFIPYVDAEGMMRPVLGAGWTLNYEMFFYVVLTASLFLAPHRRLPAVATAMVSLFLLRAIGILSGEGNLLPLYLLSESHLLFFVAGMLICKYRDKAVLGFLKWCHRRFTVPMVAVIAVGGMIAASPFVVHPGSKLLFELALCVLCVVMCVQTRTRGLKPSTPGQFQRLIVLAGDGSYSTYLTHGFVMGPVARVADRLGFVPPGWPFAMIMMLICTGVGMLIFRHFEKPLLANLNERWRAFNLTPARR